MNAQHESILIVDDDPDHLALVQRYTSSLGLPCATTQSPIEAIALLRDSTCSLLITDMVMPDMDGMELLTHARRHHPEMAVIVMTGFSRNYSYMDVIRAGAADFIVKPFQLDEYAAKVNRVLRERALLHELRLAKAKAEVASKAKTDFIHTISHELRTPMNGIIGFTELMLGMNFPGKPHEYLQLVAESSSRLMALIDKMIDFANLESTKKNLRPSEFDLASFFATLLPPVQETANRQGLKVRLTIEPGLASARLLGDTSALGRIVNHLFDNAIKFSRQGDIVIGVSARNTEETHLTLQFSVADHGCGIPEDRMAMIFDPFTQAEDYLTRQHEGVGLGLAICHRLVTLMQGNIWVESTEGHGATFYFTINLGTAIPRQQPA